MNDDELMTAAMAGSHEAFRKLVERSQSRLLRFAYGILGDRETAADAVQDALLRVWRSRGRYRPSGQANAYLMRAVRTSCIDLARRRHTRRESPIDELTPSNLVGCDQSAEASEFTAAAESALRDLPESQRCVFVLSQFEQMTYKEIADFLECPLGTVASRKFAAVESLRLTLMPWMEGVDDDRLP